MSKISTEKKKTKLAKILINRSMKQKDLLDLINGSLKSEKPLMYQYELSKFVAGNYKQLSVNKAALIAKALNISIEEIIEEDE